MKFEKAEYTLTNLKYGYILRKRNEIIGYGRYDISYTPYKAYIGMKNDKGIWYESMQSVDLVGDTVLNEFIDVFNNIPKNKLKKISEPKLPKGSVESYEMQLSWFCYATYFKEGNSMYVYSDNDVHYWDDENGLILYSNYPKQITISGRPDFSSDDIEAELFQLETLYNIETKEWENNIALMDICAEIFEIKKYSTDVIPIQYFDKTFPSKAY